MLTSKSRMPTDPGRHKQPNHCVQRALPSLWFRSGFARRGAEVVLIGLTCSVIVKQKQASWRSAILLHSLESGGNWCHFFGTGKYWRSPVAVLAPPLLPHKNKC
ncbi:unnamed protein product [Arctia plantaginis]|uniref:Uncharacterized protein n=1 Tax=Arctia plantaginis TaxID=874455 RepID=A0A8S0ZZ88_ARCPL|nr:unnamed protein product [Arctia plantaginis]